jgi:hypothetical protein
MSDASPGQRRPRCSRLPLLPPRSNRSQRLRPSHRQWLPAAALDVRRCRSAPSDGKSEPHDGLVPIREWQGSPREASPSYNRGASASVNGSPMRRDEQCSCQRGRGSASCNRYMMRRQAVHLKAVFRCAVPCDLLSSAVAFGNRLPGAGPHTRPRLQGQSATLRRAGGGLDRERRRATETSLSVQWHEQEGTAALGGHAGQSVGWQPTGHEWTGIVHWQTDFLSCIRTRDVVVCEARPASALALASDNPFGQERGSSIPCGAL